MRAYVPLLGVGWQGKKPMRKQRERRCSPARALPFGNNQSGQNSSHLFVILAEKSRMKLWFYTEN
jgi:hypothetical protein